MSVQFRLPRWLYEQIRGDLSRPHPFAAERVGFLSARPGNQTASPLLVLFTNYSVVPDADYIDDMTSGARIGSSAIRATMQRILDERSGGFHVHMHPHIGRPYFSKMDLREGPRLIESFRNVAPNLPHGMLLLSEDSCLGQVWLPKHTSLVAANRISVVGYPLEIIE